jgi:hypothetical protein
MQAHRRSVTLATAVALAALVGAAACDDVDDDITNPSRVAVVTFNDPAFVFGAQRTFSLPDTVVHLAPLNGVPLAVSREHDDAILASIRENMIARGYVENTSPATVRSDLILLAGVTASEQYAAWQSYPWFSVWGFYPGWSFEQFSNAWGVTYPWTAASYTRGTLVVDMIATRSVQPVSQRISSVWAGAAAAALTGAVTDGQIDAAIDEMFALSPYLRPIQ